MWERKFNVGATDSVQQKDRDSEREDAKGREFELLEWQKQSLADAACVVPSCYKFATWSVCASQTGMLIDRDRDRERDRDRLK